MAGKDATGAGVSCVGCLGMVEVCEGGMGCCIFSLPMGGGFLTMLKGQGPRMTERVKVMKV